MEAPNEPMRSFPVPLNERGRLRALKRLGVMDARFDGFADEAATAAASIVGAPMGAVTLIGPDFQRIKASCGLPTDDIPRAASICAHAVLSEIPLIVTNLLDDVRFRENPAVAGSPHARFYAGFPLIVWGHALGTICVVDQWPRSLSTDQIERLKKIAAGLAAWIALRPFESPRGSQDGST